MQVSNLVAGGKYKKDGLSASGAGKGTNWFGSRGFCCEGYMPPGTPTTSNILQYCTIGIGGTAVDFGDGTADADGHNQSDGEGSDGIRMTFQPGYSSGTSVNAPSNQYFNALTHSNSADFGEMVASTWPKGAASNGSRVVNSAGDYTNKDTEYFNINTRSNSIQGNDQAQTGASRAGITDGHRGVFGGGRTGGGSFHDAMEYFQIQNAYSGTDFAECASANYFFGTMSAVGGRALYLSGGTQPSNQIKAFNVSTQASAFDFGELASVQASPAGSSDGIRGHTISSHGAAGDWGSPTVTSVQYINIYSRGDSVDYGEECSGAHCRQGRGGSGA